MNTEAPTARLGASVPINLKTNLETPRWNEVCSQTIISDGNEEGDKACHWPKTRLEPDPHVNDVRLDEGRKTTGEVLEPQEAEEGRQTQELSPVTSICLEASNFPAHPP